MRDRRLLIYGVIALALWVPLGAISLPMHTLDSRFVYTTADAAHFFDTLGPSGRRAYQHIELLDLLLVFSYTAFLFRFTRRLLRSRPSDLWARAAQLSPFFIAACDLSENLLVLFLLARYPALSSRALLLLTQATPLKWAAFVVWLALTLAAWLRRRQLIA